MSWRFHHEAPLANSLILLALFHDGHLRRDLDANKGAAT